MNQNILKEISLTANELAKIGCKKPEVLKKHLFALNKLFKHFNINSLKEQTEDKKILSLLDNPKFIDVFKAFLNVNFEQGRYISPTQQILLIERLIEIIPSLNINQINLIVITSTRKGYNDFYPAAELFEPANKGLTDAACREVFKDVFQTSTIPDSFMEAFKKFYDYKKSIHPDFKYTEVILLKLAYKIRENCTGLRMVKNIETKVVDLGIAIKYLEQTAELGLKNPSKHGLSVPNLGKVKKQEINTKEDLKIPLWLVWQKAKESVCSIPQYQEKRNEIEDLFNEISPVSFDGKALVLNSEDESKAQELFKFQEVAHSIALQLGKKFTVKFQN